MWKALVYYCFLVFRRVGEYIFLICSILSAVICGHSDLVQRGVLMYDSEIRRYRNYRYYYYNKI